MEKSTSKSPPTRLFYAAIDFGTTYSGYAFASSHELQKSDSEHVKINTNNWNSGSFLSQKAPTCLLLTSDKEFHSFGYEAENNYVQLAEDGEHEQYYYFQRFKMVLHHNSCLKRDTKLEDMTGKELNALDVFSHCIRYLKDEMYKVISSSVTSLQPSDIQYVLTVPAIWDDTSKQFMREAAVKAGITTDQLIIALEPEAASIFCQKLPTEREEVAGQTVLRVGGAGTRYMIADLGGGTADITVHERLKSGKIKEVHRATGGAWGGKKVDDTFLEFLGKILGSEVIEEFKENHMDDYIELLREFETKKREASESKSKINFSIPVSLKETVKKMKKVTMAELVNKSPYGESVVFTKSQKLQVLNDTYITFFEEAVRNIVEIIAGILKDIPVNTIVLVGGFSECILVSEELRKNSATKTHRTIIPPEAGLAVLKGAVLFGYMPEKIFARVARKTYGIQSWPMYREDEHPKSKKVLIGGVPRCKDVFFKYVEIGQEVSAGHRMSQVFQALSGDETTLECTLYVSTENNPKFVTDPSCTSLGNLSIPIPSTRKGRCEIEETLIFGETELRVHARELATGQSVECTFDLM